MTHLHDPPRRRRPGPTSTSASPICPLPLKVVLWILFALFLFALPLLNIPFITTPDSDFGGVLFTVSTYVLVALGLNIVVGYAGLLDLGYVGFYAVGAYTVGVLSSQHGSLPWLWCVPVAIAVAMVSGVILGAPTLRVRGDYLAIVTLGFGEIVRLTLVNSEWLGGAQGISDIPQAARHRALRGAEHRLEHGCAGRRPRHDDDVPQVRHQRLHPVLLARARRHRPRAALRHPRQEQPGRPSVGGHPGGRGRRRAHGRADLPLQAARLRARRRHRRSVGRAVRDASRASSTRRASSCSCRSSSSRPSSSVARATAGASSSARSSSATSPSGSASSPTSGCSSSAWR